MQLVKIENKKVMIHRKELMCNVLLHGHESLDKCHQYKIEC